jgi:coenzyme F420 hydrogenase subunit delta
MDDMPQYYGKRILVFGCGNILFGDDGFGPIVADELIKNYPIPDDISVINAGTSIRELLFNIMVEDKKPEIILIIDAIDASRDAGEIFNLELDDLPENKIDDFSLHQSPTTNLLRELRDHGGVDVRILSCQVEKLPESIDPGLSEILKERVSEMCDLIVSRFFKAI